MSLLTAYQAGVGSGTAQWISDHANKCASMVDRVSLTACQAGAVSLIVQWINGDVNKSASKLDWGV